MCSFGFVLNFRTGISWKFHRFIKQKKPWNFGGCSSILLVWVYCVCVCSCGSNELSSRILMTWMTTANNKWHVVFKRLSLPASWEPCNCPCKVSPKDFVGCLDIIQQKAYCKNIWNRCVRKRETKEGLPGTSHGTSTSKSHTTTICCRDFYPQRILNPWTIYHHLHIWVKCNQCNNSPSFQSY